MAVFNPEVGGVPSPNMPDQTGASRGVDTNRAFEYLFKGIGDAVGGVAGAIDSDIKRKIEYDAQGAADTAMKPYTDTIPNELRDSGSALKSLQTAYEQGKISDVYYTGQLTTMTKAMRAKYPGYEAYVDDTIQGVTGIRPANAYREALMQQFQAEASVASDGEKFKRQWEKDNEGVIGIFYEDYFTNPGKWAFEEVQQSVANWKTKDALEKAAAQKLDTEIKQNNVNEVSARQAATTALNQSVGDMLQGLSNSLGIGGDDFQKKIASMSSGANFNGEEYNGLVTELNNAEQAMKQALLKKFRGPLVANSSSSYASVLSGKEKEMIEEAMAPFYAIKQLVTDKEFGLAGTYLRINTIQADAAKAKILGVPEFANALALSEISGDLGMQYLNDVDPTLKGVFGALAAESPARIVAGKDTLTDLTTRVVESTENSADKVAFINSTINKLQATVTSGNGSASEVSNAVKSLYEVSKGKDVFDRVNQDQYYTLYNKMYNPQITEAIALNGSKEDMQNYMESARARIGQIPELAKAAASLGDVNSNWKEYFEVKMNDKTGALELNVKQDGVPLVDIMGNQRHSGLLGALDYSFNKGIATDAINKLNVALDTYGGIAEKMGMDPGMRAGLYSQVFKELNVNLEQGAKEGFFKWLMDTATETFAISQEDTNASTAAILGFDTGSSPTIDAMGNTGNLIADTIIGFEGFRDTPYYDVNANRVGYGSDTVTNEDGTFSKVTESTRVTKDGAGRDLIRRLTTEFIPEIVDDIGADTWSGLSTTQQAALSSIAYNYGSLPTKVVKAIKTGDPTAVAEAIRSLSSNRDRRAKEAAMYLS